MVSIKRQESPRNYHACTKNIYLHVDDISKYARTELIEYKFLFVFCECFYGNVAVLDQFEDCL